MGLPEVGLQAVLEGTGKFEADAKGVSNSVTDLGNTVLKTAGIMSGIALGAVGALGAGLVGLAGSALGPIGDFERMSASLSSLVAREVQAGDSTLSFDEALQKAGPATKDLIDWVEQLAIISPFESKDVATAMQMAMSFGLTTDRAKELVSAEINFAAATGKGGDAMQRISMALGKMNTSGKVSGEVLMQLAEAGVPAQKILQEMGYTAEDASKGLVPVDKFMSAVIDDFNKFGSAAQAQANTWPGLLSSLEDLKKIALREFFTKTFEAIKPYVVEFVTMLQDPGVRKWLSQVGELLGTTIANGLSTVVGWVKEAKTWLDGFIPMILEVAQDLNFAADVEWHEYFPSWLADAVEWLIENLPMVKGALEGIGAVLAGAAIAAAVAGIGAAILALANPITLLLAAGAALGAAWETNWMGMRDTLTEFWNTTAKPALEKLRVWFEANLPIAMQKLSDFWSTTLLPALQELAKWLKDEVPKAAEAVVKFWKQDLVPAVTRFSNWVMRTGIPAVKDFVEWFNEKLVPAVKEAAKWLETKLVPVLKDLEKSLEKAQVALAGTSQEMTKTGGTFDKLADFWEANGDQIKKTTTDVFNYVANFIEEKINIAKDTVGLLADVMAGDWGDALKRMQSIQENILNTMTLGIYGWVQDIGKSIGTGLRNISTNWQSVWSGMLTTTTTTIGTWLTTTASQISNFASTMYNSAVALVNGLINGITSRISAFSSSLINAVASGIASLISSVVSGSLSSSLTSVGNTIMNLIVSGVSAVTTLASSLINSVASAIANLVTSIASGALFNTLRAVGGAIIDGLVNGINASANEVAQALSYIVNAAIQSIKDQLGITGDPQPSTYMAAVGAALMQGYARGILSQTGTVTDSMQAAMAGAMSGGGLTLAPSLVAAPGLGGGGGNTTVNNFHIGGNNITSGMDQAVFEARVLSVIRKNLR